VPVNTGFHTWKSSS